MGSGLQHACLLQAKRRGDESQCTGERVLLVIRGTLHAYRALTVLSQEALRPLQAHAEREAAEAAGKPVKRRRGRPPGSKTKAKAEDSLEPGTTAAESVNKWVTCLAEPM